jgi:NADPH2:quinone reductase
VFACSDSFFPHHPEGSYAELASVAEAHLARLPPNLSFEEGAVVPLVSLTAWQALRSLPLPSGSRVLVHGGSGGVGSMAIQVRADSVCL